MLESLETSGVPCALYDRVRVEPTDESFLDAIAFARERPYDAFVAVGGGSTIDTAKAVNLYTTYPPADFLDYVNPPIGKGLPVPGPLKPLIAIPTTAGTGSETTGVSIFDLHAAAREDRHRQPPAEADARLSRSREHAHDAAAGGGLDRPRHPEPRDRVVSPRCRSPTGRGRTRPALRPAYQGSNPISDIWSLQALRMVAQFLVRAVDDPSDDEARAKMLLAASYAGVGFGNAGVHLPHGMSYPVSGNVKSYRAPGYAADHPLVPHGISVILNAPAVFRFTARANPGAPPAGRRSARRRHVARRARRTPERSSPIASPGSCSGCSMPNGLRAIGYTSADIPALVEGTLPQHRVTKLSPRPAGPEELARLFEEALTAW